MARHVLVALTNPADGREDEYNDWYDNTHLKDVLDVPGFVSAQRFRLSAAQRMQSPPYKYLAIYEIETDDIHATIGALCERSGTMLLPISDALHEKRDAPVYEPLTPVITRARREPA